MQVTEDQQKRMDALKRECPSISSEYGVDSRDLWSKFSKSCESNGVPGSVGRGRGVMKGYAKDLRGF
jgi:hypothetical protein